MGVDLRTVNLARRTFVDNIPSVIAIQTSVQSIPNNTNTAITFNTTNGDNWTGWSAGNPTRYTIPVSGVYLIDGCVSWTGNATGRRFIFIRLNGSITMPGSGSNVASTGTNNLLTSTGTMLRAFVAGDYVELVANQDSGAALNTITTGATSPSISSLTVRWVHR